MCVCVFVRECVCVLGVELQDNYDKITAVELQFIRWKEKKEGKNVFVGTENQSSAFRPKSHETKSGLSFFATITT